MQRNLCLVKTHHYSLLNKLGNPFWIWRGHVVLVRFHLSRRDHLKKGFMIPATGVSVAGLPSMGSNIFSNVASPSGRAQDSIEMSVVPCPCVEQVLCQFWLTRLG